MRHILIIFCFIILKSPLLASGILINPSDSTETPEYLKAAWKEWSHYKMKLLRENKINKDSTEKYAIDKKSGQIAYVTIHRRISKKRGENIFYYFLNGKLLKILMIISDQSALGIWKDTESGVYLFKNDTLVLKREFKIVPQDESILFSASNLYYNKAMQYVKDDQKEILH
jgi:hypothetical protein